MLIHIASLTFKGHPPQKRSTKGVEFSNNKKGESIKMKISKRSDSQI